MVKIIINIVLLAISAFLAFQLWESIQEPVRFKKALEDRETAVRSKLKQIATLQTTHKNLRGKYAGSFSELANTLNSDTFTVYKINGDPDDTAQVVTIDTLLILSADSMARLNVDFKNLAQVPYAKSGVEFKVDTASIPQPNVEGVFIPVFEVRTTIGDFMFDYLDEEGEEEKYKRFDATFKPNRIRKVGDLMNATSAGNW